jgi:hypothetical protein
MVEMDKLDVMEEMELGGRPDKNNQGELIMSKIPDNLVPLIYLLAVAVIAGGLTYLKVTPEVTGLIIGAGITRIKISTEAKPGA